MSWAEKPTDDLLGDKPIWGIFGDTVISEDDKESLRALRDRTGGWFYKKDDQLKFVTLDEWEAIKTGARLP